MLKVFLCEDNVKQRRILEKYIRDIIMIEDLDIKFELATSNPEDILEYIDNIKGTGIYFLDIDLKSSINGLELAEKIRNYDPRGFIIFVTAHSELTYLTFMYKLEALDFIVKRNVPEIKERIKSTIKEAFKRYTAKNNNSQEVLTINVGEKVYCIDYKDIIYIETSVNVHKLVLHSKNRELEFYGKMKDVEAILNENFIRIHKSFLINRNNIKEIDKKNKVVVMSNNDACIASVRLFKNVCTI